MEYINTNPINQLDYWSLVNMLMIQITPEYRQKILDRLTEMNKQLMIGLDSQIGMQSDLTRPNIVNSREKNPSKSYYSTRIKNKPTVSDNTIKSQYHNNSQPQHIYKHNPIPLDRSVNTDNIIKPQYSEKYNPGSHKISRSGGSINIFSDDNVDKYNLFNTSQTVNEIDIDDIINDIHKIPDRLDEKLAKIKKLHDKIVTNKK